MAALKVETDVASIAASLIGWAGILVIMYVETFKMDVIGFLISIKPQNVTSHWPIFSSIRVNPLILTILLSEIKGKMSNLPIKFVIR